MDEKKMTEEKTFKYCNTCCTLVPPCLQLPLWFAAACALALILCGVLLAEPGLHSKTYQVTTCTPVLVTNRGVGVCNCSSEGSSRFKRQASCASTFPCIDVLVRFNAGGHQVTTKIYNDETSFSISEKCSVDLRKSCSSNRVSNEDEIERWVSSYGSIHQSYTCWYDPSNFENVISRQPHDNNSVFAALIAPIVLMVFFLILSAVSFYYHMCVPGCFEACYVSSPSSKNDKALLIA